MTEQAYIEICNDFKDIIEEKDEELKKYKQLYMCYKKLICKLYGLSRCLDNHIDNSGLDNEIISNLIETIRGDCSDMLFSREEIDMGLYPEVNLNISLV